MKTLIASSTLALFFFLSGCEGNRETWIQGQSEARTYRIASRLAGRLISISPREGDSVTAGTVLAILASPEITAKASQADGLIAAATAQRDKALHGARREEIAAAKANWERAAAARRLADTTAQRIERLFAQGVVPAQKRDEAITQRDAALGAEHAALAQLQMARAGARSEDKSASEGLLSQAKGGRAEVAAWQEEANLRAPHNGVVQARFFEPGEVVPAGMPVLSIVDLADTWVVANVREDLLHGLQTGAVLLGRIPALGNEAHKFQVFLISPAGDFATWRATREGGSPDLRTFEVRARPQQPLPGLRPGMTVELSFSANKS